MGDSFAWKRLKRGLHKITIKYLLLKISHKYEIIILKYTFTSVGKSDKKVKIKNKLIILT